MIKYGLILLITTMPLMGMRIKVTPDTGRNIKQIKSIHILNKLEKLKKDNPLAHALLITYSKAEYLVVPTICKHALLPFIKESSDNKVFIKPEIKAVILSQTINKKLVNSGD